MIKVALVGVGNCASSLVQAVQAAKTGKLGTSGLSHVHIGGYKVEDIQFVAAFDVDQRKVGADLSQAILAKPNCTTNYVGVPSLGVKVELGVLADGVAEHMNEMFLVDPKASQTSIDEITKILADSAAEIVVSYLPVGSQKASEAYAESALKAGCAFVNCTPAVLANGVFAERFAEAGLPLLGDDVKSQVGSTAIHRALIDILEKKGITIQRTYQLNIGGNTDFMNMRDPNRASGKKITKESSLRHLFSGDPELGVGPSDFVPQLKDHKVGYINIEGEGLMGMPFSLELKLKVEDSPNSAGVVLNAIRSAKTALDRKMAGPIHEVCPWLFKKPPHQVAEADVFQSFNEFIAE